MLSSEQIFHLFTGNWQVGNLDKEFSCAVDGMSW